jgi:hypothetical protein
LIGAIIGAQALQHDAAAEQIGERVGLFTEIDECRIGEFKKARWIPLLGSRQNRDLLGMRNWHRLEQKSIDDAEDQGIGADAERERDGDDSRQARRL